MSENIASEFAALATKQHEVIAERAEAWAARLQGSLANLKAVLGDHGRKLGLESPDRSEIYKLRTIVLSAVLTSVDPYVAGSATGTRMVAEISAAAAALGVDMTDVQPLSRIENELFEALQANATK
ncbi:MULTISPECIES: hypothetical protein [Burkholderia cepacia complex]|uniref:hypothetical protein n=1 Tax=Burkholderia cepacia complex TaxID=87882 RepID=UPI0012D9AAAE|nr:MULTISPECIES: hypothetical protein [Burkholderia cepacia complex]